MKLTRIAVAIVFVAVVLCGALALAANPNLPPNCQPCGNEFKNEVCGIAEDPVEAYRANGAFVALYSNRCFGCQAKGVFCTASTGAQ